MFFIIARNLFIGFISFVILPFIALVYISENIIQQKYEEYSYTKIDETRKLIGISDFYSLDKITKYMNSNKFESKHDNILIFLNNKKVYGREDINVDYKKLYDYGFVNFPVHFNGLNFYSGSYPIYDDKKVVGRVVIISNNKELVELIFQYHLMLALSMIAICLIVLVAGYATSKKLISSFDEISMVTGFVREGDLSKRVKTYSKDELSRLGENINKMIESLQDRENKIHDYQRALHGQKEYLESIFNSLNDGFITIGSDSRIIKVNPTIEIWTGLKEEEVLGKKLDQILKCDCKVDCKEEVDLALCCPLITQNERLIPTEAKIINQKTALERYLGIVSSPVASTNHIEEPTYVILLRDITEYKELDKMRENFTATLTHDLRVPILAESNTIKLFLKGMFGSLNEKQQIALQNMLESNNDLVTLVNKLLDIYKIESGRFDLLKEPVDMNILIVDLISELSSIAIKNHQKLDTAIKTQLPLIYADRNEIKRVLQNLVGNALAYTHKEGKILIDAYIQDSDIIVSVKDDGRGISSEEQEQLFSRYFSGAKKFRKVGTGLGLYLSKQIVEKHGGKIWFESTSGVGSSFFFSLPVGHIENKGN
ncbi:MAG: ATP-binding protein [bacterium]